MTTDPKELADLARHAEVLKQRLKDNVEALAAARVCNKITMTFTGKKIGEVGELRPTGAQLWGGLLDQHDFRNTLIYSLEAQRAEWQAELDALDAKAEKV